MNGQLVYGCIGGFTAGVLLHSFISVSLGVSVYGFSVTLLIVLYLALIGRATAGIVIKKFRPIFLAALVACCFFLRLIRYEVFIRDRGDTRLFKAAGNSIIAEGIVTEEPEVRDQDIRITVALSSFSSAKPVGGMATAASPSIKITKVLASLPLYTSVAYGDRIKISGMLDLPENFETDNGREFDYVSFLAKNKIFFLMQQADIEVIAHHSGNRVKEMLLQIKTSFLEKIFNAISAPESGLMAGLLVSGKQALPGSIVDQFKRVGIIHVVALSGYNVSIVAESLGKILSFLPATIGLLAGGLGIIGFTIMAGANSTIVRASIMALLVIASKLLSRSYNVSRALLIAGFVMIAINPMILIFDPSFQLSFLSTIGIMHVSPIVSRWVTWVPQAFKLRETVIATLATQLFVLPYLLYSSGQLSVVALPVNLLVLFFVPFTMLMGFLTGMLGFVSFICAIPAAFISYLFLHYDLSVVSFFSSLPFASIKTPSFSPWLLVASYIGYTIIIVRFHKKMNTEKADLILANKIRDS